MKSLKREHKQAKQLLVQHKQELDPTARKALRLMIELNPKRMNLNLHLNPVSIELQPSYARIRNEAIACFLKANVHPVTFNTLWFRILIDPFVSRH